MAEASNRGINDESKEYLLNAKNEVKRRDELLSNLNSMKTRYKKLSRDISSEEKSISSEIAQTTKKRRQEIEGSYEKRLDSNRARRKKEEYKRDKKKTERINRRIEEETRDLVQDSRLRLRELKDLCRRERVPSLCTKKYYYVMFAPNGMDEVLAMFLSMVLYFVGLPAGVTFLFKKLVFEKKAHINMPFWCVLVAAIIVIFNLLVYFVIMNSTKGEHREVVMDGRKIYDKIKRNKRRINGIKRSINNDRDESQYNLDAFDKKLKEIDKESKDINSEKRKALKTFDEDSIHDIASEINNRRLPGLKEMQDQLHQIEEDISDIQAMYDDQANLVERRYARRLGEDLCKVNKIESLITLMDEGTASTVTEAIRVYQS